MEMVYPWLAVLYRLSLLGGNRNLQFPNGRNGNHFISEGLANPINEQNRTRDCLQFGFTNCV
jgi:hypothetical protein